MVLTVSWIKMSVVKEKVPLLVCLFVWYLFSKEGWFCQSSVQAHAAGASWGGVYCSLSPSQLSLCLPSDAPSASTWEPCICFPVWVSWVTSPCGCLAMRFPYPHSILCASAWRAMSLCKSGVCVSRGLSEKAAKHSRRNILLSPRSSSLKICLNINNLLKVKRAFTEASQTPELEFSPSGRNWSFPNFYPRCIAISCVR